MGQRETISSARDLRLPTELTKEILSRVPDEARMEFIDEMLDALNHAEESDDLSSVQYVMNAWWISGLFLNHELIEKALDAAESFDETDLVTAEQIGELLQIA